MKTRHVDYPRSAIIVHRLDYEICRFPAKASYADSRTLHGLGFPPRTSLTTGYPVEKPAVSDAATGIVISIYRSRFSLLTHRVEIVLSSEASRWGLVNSAIHFQTPQTDSIGSGASSPAAL